jgi:hypothetical protein
MSTLIFITEYRRIRHGRVERVRAHTRHNPRIRWRGPRDRR